MEFLKLLAGLPILSWFFERRRSIVDHDKRAFQDFDAILPEERLTRFLDSTAGGAFVPMWLLSEIEEYLEAASRAKHDFVSRSVRTHHDLFVKALGSALHFLSEGLQPSRNINSENLHFLPHLNIDMYAVDGSGMDQFDEEFRQLQALMSAVDVHYRRYRRVVHERLLV